MSVDFNINDLAAKCRSKYELYSVLTTEGGVYLPPLQEATQKYFREILIGWKQYISCKKINVPHYKGLTVQDLPSFAELNVNIRLSSRIWI